MSIRWEYISRKIIREEDMEEFLRMEGLGPEITDDSTEVIELANENGFVSFLVDPPGLIYFIRKEDVPYIIVDKKNFSVYYKGQENYDIVLFDTREKIEAFEKELDLIRNDDNT